MDIIRIYDENYNTVYLNISQICSVYYENKYSLIIRMSNGEVFCMDTSLSSHSNAIAKIHEVFGIK